MYYQEKIDLYRPNEPTGNEILNALAGNEPEEDWREEILEKANPKLVAKVREILEEYQVFGEAEIALEELLERRCEK